MTIQILGQNILIRDGAIATHEDCCCEEPCIECQPCPTCWSSELAPCNALDSFDVTISGTTGTYSSCSCSSLNSTFSYDITTYQCSPTGTEFSVFENCVLGTLNRYSISVAILFRFSTSDIPITSQSELDAYAGAPLNSKFCNSFTIKKGHWVEVQVAETFTTIFPFSRSTLRHHFLYSFDNHDIKPGCPDDQSYGLCSGLSSGGNATYVYTSLSGFGSSSPPSCFWDFGFSNKCDLSSIVVQIGAVQVSVGP